MTELPDLTAVELVAQYRAKTLSPGQPVRRLMRCARTKIVTALRGLPTL